MSKIALALFLFLPLLSFSAGAEEKTLRDEIDTNVAKLATMMGDLYSLESPGYRGIEILRNDKEGLIVAVAVFTVEGIGGGNDYTQFMAVFSSLSEESDGHPRKMSLLDVMAVGGKGVRGVDFKKIRIKQSKKDIVITVPTEEYGPKDAMCCPSIKSEAKFIIRPEVGGRLKEITKRNNR